ncbi:MAG: hypothetical protein K0B87_07720 [Candidatus Syntrophosphaera sp.]|nr:hypothetical protein [Candidatus Syntrophosphaera sp.]
MRVDEGDYRSWRGQFGTHELDFTRILEGIWKLLCGDCSWLEERDGFYLLIEFSNRARQKQNQMIRELCELSRRNRWEVHSARAAALFLRLKPQAGILGNKLAALDGEGFYRYLYRVLENNLILCNNQLIEELINSRDAGRSTETLRNDDGLPDEALYEGLTRPGRNYKTLHDLINDLQARLRASQLRAWLKEDWEPQDLNALCQYYEALGNIETERLGRESKDYVDQIHSRLRNKFRNYLEYKGLDTEDARAFFTLELPKLCQETPVSATYKIREGETDVSHTE